MSNLIYFMGDDFVGGNSLTITYTHSFTVFGCFVTSPFDGSFMQTVYEFAVECYDDLDERAFFIQGEQDQRKMLLN
jgi:hypothetical protein